MFIYGSKEVSVNGCKFIAPGNSPNTDGIHIQYSSGITIRNSQMMTGDDCISIGPGSSNVWIQGIFCGPGHGIRFVLMNNLLGTNFGLITHIYIYVYIYIVLAV